MLFVVLIMVMVRATDRVWGYGLGYRAGGTTLGIITLFSV